MSTWAGAIVQTGGRSDFPAIAAKYHITVQDGTGPWIGVHGNVNFASLCPPAFAEALSRDLGGTVVAFFVQTTSRVEQVQHWENGCAVRTLTYSGDGGGWVTEGRPQPWERACFFADGESTSEGATWPSNLGDELSDEDVARYDQARRPGTRRGSWTSCREGERGRFGASGPTSGSIRTARVPAGCRRPTGSRGPARQRSSSRSWRSRSR